MSMSVTCGFSTMHVTSASAISRAGVMSVPPANLYGAEGSCYNHGCRARQTVVFRMCVCSIHTHPCRVSGSRLVLVMPIPQEGLTSASMETWSSRDMPAVLRQVCPAHSTLQVRPALHKLSHGSPVVRVFHAHGEPAVLQRGLHRERVQHRRAEVRQLRGLVKGQQRDRRCARHHARVAGQDACREQ